MTVAASNFRQTVEKEPGMKVVLRRNLRTAFLEFFTIFCRNSHIALRYVKNSPRKISS